MPAPYVEIARREIADSEIAAWRDLCARALDANVFAEPAFVLNALREFARSDRLILLFVWQEESRKRLIGAVVLDCPKPSFGLAAARVWQSNQAALGALVVDRDSAEASLSALIDWLGRKRPAVAGLLAPNLDTAGSTFPALQALAARRSAPLHIVGRRNRAVLTAASSAAGFEAALPKKRLKEWNRQMRRLQERGKVAFVVASDAAATEKFLALEAAGWKGARRTALGADAGLAAFARSMLSDLGRAGAMSVHFLTLDDQPVAAGVVLLSGGRAFYWKTAYQEFYAEYSPGVLLTRELSRALERDSAIASTDSCAIENHPMIDKLWSNRLMLADCAIASRPGSDWRLALWLAGERAKRNLRETAKRWINPLRGRKRS
jgi:CelD/BcsL family acetyltransferase involved in cellulose biosynthesis